MVSSNEFWRGSRRRTQLATFSAQFHFNDVRLQDASLKSLNFD
jgi:hypothetical protein